MPSASALLAIATLVLAAPLARAAEEPITLQNAHGAALTFTEKEGSWAWTRLLTPRGPKEGWTVVPETTHVATPDQHDVLPAGWSLVEALPDRVVLEQQAEGTGLAVRRAYFFGAAKNTVRVETSVRSIEGTRTVASIGLLELQVEGESFRETGVAPASFPIFGQSLFLGIEHISGECFATDNVARLMQRPRLAVDGSWRVIATAIVGWPQPGTGVGVEGDYRIREAFLQYLDTVRIIPDRMVLHSETWWTLPPPLFEKDVLKDIETLRKAFLDRTGMFFDTYTLDLGWSNPRSFWQIERRRFPNDFRVINERLNSFGTRLGLWMSPGSGYPDGLNNHWLNAQGYEMTPFGAQLDYVPCFALGGRYQREFKAQLLSYAQQYGLGHLILDFMAHYCDVASHGHPTGIESRYAIDAGVADILDSLRAVNPKIALEPMVCGYPPSPWWLMKTPFILGPAGDDVPLGRVPCPEWLEALITARDAAYRAGQEAWIMPTQALETWDIVVQTPGQFQNTAVMAIGRGRWFLSSYIKPDLMKPEDWDFFAAMVRWARHNKEFLVNAWMFGGRAEDREAYGYMFRNATKDLYCVRNPWIEERTIQLPESLVAKEARDLRMIYPRRMTIARLEPGQPGPEIRVGPYETIFLETVPVGEAPPIRGLSDTPVVTLEAPKPRLLAEAVAESPEETRGLRFFWDGSLTIPEVNSAELCVLIEGGPEVELSTCSISLRGREAKVRRSASAGQFGAAVDASPDNWVWFIVPLPKGTTTFNIDLSSIADEATVAVFVRGTVAEHSDPAPETEPAFPVFKSNERAWSRTLLEPTLHTASKN